MSVEVFFDGACPLCSREARLLRRRDRAGRLRFTDISAPGFSSPPGVPPLERLMERMHIRLEDGSWAEGVEAFRRVYDLLGYGWLVRWTRGSLVSAILERAYAAFARDRHRWGGRCPQGACAWRSLGAASGFLRTPV